MEYTYSGHRLVIDSIESSASPIVRVMGWYDCLENPEFFIINAAGEKVPALNCYRTWRPDVVGGQASSVDFCGFVTDFHVRSGRWISFGEQRIEIPQYQSVGTVSPHYEALLTHPEVFHRSDIYTYGPPTDIAPELLRLCMQVEGTILDFGCGNGSLVKLLRQAGRDAVGIELASERVEGKMYEDINQYLRLYDGKFPMPFANQSFDYVIATEVMEHMDHLEEVVSEFTRVSKRGVLVTVPDMSSIPAGYMSHVVPWHMLESTHVNFFNFNSIRNIFSPYFEASQYYRIGNTTVNNLYLPGSLGVVFNKK